MRSIYAITYCGPVVAVVVGDQAVIAEELAGPARRIVEAKCLYAMQVDAGDLPGPYRDRDAEDYARVALDRAAGQQDRSGRPALTPRMRARRGHA